MDVRQAACQMGQRALDGFMALGFDDAPRVTSFYLPLPSLRQARLDMDLANSNRCHEAALAERPPSKTRYAPDGDGTPLKSLGVHEHWNRAEKKQYSRNLGTGQGIELVKGA